MAESIQIESVQTRDLMASLQRQGVTDLQTLVEKAMAAAAKQPAGKSGCCFICKGYVYIVLEE